MSHVAEISPGWREMEQRLAKWMREDSSEESLRMKEMRRWNWLICRNIWNLFAQKNPELNKESTLVRWIQSSDGENLNPCACELTKKDFFSFCCFTLFTLWTVKFILVVQKIEFWFYLFLVVHRKTFFWFNFCFLSFFIIYVYYKLGRRLISPL